MQTESNEGPSLATDSEEEVASAIPVHETSIERRVSRLSDRNLLQVLCTCGYTVNVAAWSAAEHYADLHERNYA